jgi:hypothetical protein
VLPSRPSQYIIPHHILLCFPPRPSQFIIPQHIVTYHEAVVWLITRRGFGLVTGFIRFGDYYCIRLQLQWAL